VRFDDVYYSYFKTCAKLMRESPALKGYVADVYQTPGVGRSVNVAHIRAHCELRPVLSGCVCFVLRALCTP
jgi:putative glutathione S-transferase